MTRKRFQKLCIEMCDRIQMKYNGKHVNGKTLKWYRDKSIKTINSKSYAEAWDMLKLARQCVDM